MKRRLRTSERVGVEQTGVTDYSSGDSVGGWMTPTAVLRGTRESKKPQPTGLRFRAVLGEEPKAELGLL